MRVNIVDLARAFHGHEFNVLPVDADKASMVAWKRWENERQTADDVAALPFNRAKGVAAVCGAVSAREGACLVCIDADKAPGRAPLESLLGNLGLPRDYPWAVHTPGKGGGWHVWIVVFGLPAELAKKGLSAGALHAPFPGADHIELRWNAAYAVLPGSAHPEGGFYKWEHGNGTPPAEAPAAVDAKRVVRLAKWHGETKDGTRAPAPPLPAEILEHEGRDNAMFSLACTLQRRGVHPDDILGALKLSNARLCKPPLDESVLRTKVKSASKYAPAAPLGEMVAGVGHSLSPVEKRPDFGSSSDPKSDDDEGKAEPTPPPLEDRTDAGNAAVFVRLMGARVRHVAAWDAWVVYDGRRWMRDATHEVEALMGEALLTRFDEAACADDVEASKKLAAWAVSSRSTAKRDAALRAARSDRRIAARPEDFDRDLYRFNCQNGTLDLRTGELLPHDPAALITKLAPVAFDADARSDLWERVLAEVTDGDDELQAALQRVAGYCLTGDTGEEVFFLFHGPQASIKSTFLGAVSATVGDYSMAVDPEVFLRRAHVGGPRDDVAGMEGARLVVCAEFDRGGSMAEALLKQLTGGDTVRARHLYQAAREFRFTAKIAMHSNLIPAMSDDDGAVRRRLWAIAFNHTVPEEKRDPAVKARLCDPRVSGPAILAWAVRGCLDWQRQGLGKPPAVALATQAVWLSMDPLGDFFDDCCIMDPAVWTPSAALRGAYERWAKATGRKHIIGLREWGKRLTGRGLQNVKHNGARGWTGARLVDAETVESAFDLEDSRACVDSTWTVSRHEGQENA